jgi:hypothetical protein
MICQSCGNPVEGTFCSRCGAQVLAAAPLYSAPPPILYVPRVQQHVQTLGILWCVFGVYRAATGIFGAMFLFGMSRPGFFGDLGSRGDLPMWFHAPWMSGLASFVAVVTLVYAALSFAVGFSLLNRKPWGRTLAIVAAILQLIKIPFGTALGIYTLWVLAPATSGVEYDAIADRT